MCKWGCEQFLVWPCEMKDHFSTAHLPPFPCFSLFPPHATFIFPPAKLRASKIIFEPQLALASLLWNWPAAGPSTPSRRRKSVDAGSLFAGMRNFQFAMVHGVKRGELVRGNRWNYGIDIMTWNFGGHGRGLAWLILEAMFCDVLSY